MHRMLLDLPARLETDRLIVRPYQAGDGPAYHDVCLRNKEHLLPFEEGNPALEVTTAEEAEILVREFAAAWVARSAFFFGAWKKSDPAVFVAQLYVGAVSWELPEFEIGYFVDQQYEGHGYVTEGVNAALIFAFDHLQAQRVRLGCNDTNTRSYRVAERCGFTREGHVRQNRKNVLLPDGTPSGEYLYGLLRDEFEALRKH